MWQTLIKDDSNVWYDETFKTNDYLQCFIQAFIISNLCTTIHDQNGKIVFILNLPEIWTLEKGLGIDEARLFGAGIYNQFNKLRDLCLDTNSDQTASYHACGRTFEFNCSPMNINGMIYIVTVISDRTDDRRREKTLQTLLREVSHRSKNMLAIVQSIASQTDKHSATIENFLKKFTGRIYSLSASQDLITNSSWEGARFFQLALEQTERYATENDAALTISGDDIDLNPNEALHIGLALHELVVNSLAYGVLSQGQGEISITSKSLLKDEQVEIKIEWRECLDGIFHHKKTHVIQPEKKFGVELLERILPAAVSGSAEYTVGLDSIVYKLTFLKTVE